MIRKKAERFGKRTLVRILKTFIRSEHISEVSLEEIRRILVVRQDDRIGNLVLITPMLEALRQGCPDRRIVLLAGQSFHEILQGNPHCDEIFVLEKRPYAASPVRFVRLIRRLRAERFDLALDCSHAHAFSFSNGLLTYLSGAPLRMGYRRGDSDVFLNVLIPPPSDGKHASEVHLDLVRSLGAKVNTPTMRIFVDETERTSICRSLREKGISEDDRVCGIHIGGSGKKRWPIKKYARLADKLNEHFGFKVIIVCGQKEEYLLPDLVGHMRITPVITSSLRVREMVALIERCDIFIAPDTGPMHLSVAVGTPTVAIFLAPNFGIFGPQGKEHRIAHRPGGKVDVDDVMAAVRTMSPLNSITADESKSRA